MLQLNLGSNPPKPSSSPINVPTPDAFDVLLPSFNVTASQYCPISNKDHLSIILVSLK